MPVHFDRLHKKGFKHKQDGVIEITIRIKRQT